MIWAFLFSLLVVNALFGHAVFGINARPLLFIVLAAITGYLVVYTFFHQEPFEILIEQEHITTNVPLGSENMDFPIYGKNDMYYYAIYPAVHQRISRKNACPGFVATNIDTWCGDEKFMPHCNTPDKPENCTIILSK